MQTKTTFLFVLLMLGISFSQARLLRVNNSPGSSAPYTDLITAHAAAFSGDTLMIEGSNQDYGSLIIEKQLVILGPGYLQSENDCTPSSLAAVVNRFDLNQTTSNDPFSGAAGTEIRGLSFSEQGLSGIRLRVSNVTIAKCYFEYAVDIQSFDVSGTTVIQNYFDGSGIVSNGVNPGLNGLVFTNNIVTGNFTIVDNSTGIISHNCFLGSRLIVNSFNGEFRSNIASSTTTTPSNFSVTVTGSNMLSHNTASAGQFGNTNSNNVAPANQLFVGAANNSTDGQYQLLPNATAARNNAHDGTDRGAFGGLLPYALSGVPNVPFISSLQIDATGLPTRQLNATIEAKSSN